jgi:hypothetical protein
VELTSAFLGDKFRGLTEHFETMRRKRNDLTYEAGTLLSATEARRAFADAVDLVKQILSEAKSRNPQLEITFNIRPH